MAQRAHRRMPHRLRHLARQLLAWLSLAGVQAQLYPLELVEHVVGEVELAVAPDVDFRAAQHAERRDLLVHRGDLLRLTA